MAIEILMPKLGIYMERGKIARWLKSEGDFIEKGEPILVIETDKLNFEVEAAGSGILKKILFGENEEAQVNSVVGIIGEAREEIGEIKPAKRVDSKAIEKRVDTVSASTGETDPFIKATPLARRTAKDHNVDLKIIKGSGPGGRIVQEDVFSAVAKIKEVRKESTEIQVEMPQRRSIPLSRMREIIAERLTQSFRDTPHIFFSVEVDTTHLIQMRNTVNKMIEKECGIRLSYSDILIKATAKILKKYPYFNATLQANEIVILPDINIGLAVGLEDGLIVPVLRKVDRMEFLEIVKTRNDLVERARQKKLMPDDLKGGTFTLSNLGAYEIDSFTSIINPPEVGILSVARIKERAVVENGAIVIRPTMMVGLSADHRVVDGATAASFLQDLKRLLENPYMFIR